MLSDIFALVEADINAQDASLKVLIGDHSPPQGDYVIIRSAEIREDGTTMGDGMNWYIELMMDLWYSNNRSRSVAQTSIAVTDFIEGLGDRFLANYVVSPFIFLPESMSANQEDAKGQGERWRIVAAWQNIGDS